MTDDLAARAAEIGALAEPVRRDLYGYVVAQPDAVGREEAARACGMPAHSAKFHLDRLVEAGLLDTEYRRIGGRTGPGAGRTSKLYRRSATTVSVTLPDRRYDLAGAILATAVERSTAEQRPLAEAVTQAAGEAGRDVGRNASHRGSEVTRTCAALAATGFEPRQVDAEVELANCPFDALARRHTALVCGMNRDFVEGMLQGLGCDDLDARLDPRPGLCCVRVSGGGRAEP